MSTLLGRGKVTMEAAMDAAAARAKALEYLGSELPGDDKPTIMDGQTRETPLFWVFVWNSSRYLQTGDERFSVIGNAPVVISKADGAIYRLPTGWPLEQSLAELTDRLARHRRNGE